MTIPEPNNPERGDGQMGSHPRPTTAQRAIPPAVAALIILLDQFSKLFVEIFLPLNRSWAPIPELAHLLRISHVSNTGAALGLFPGGSQIFTVIAIVVALAIVVYNYDLPAGNRALRLGLGLQVGGALGNLIDRLRLGHVTDFLDVGGLPVFNLADASIVAGVLLLGVLIVKEQRENSAREQAGAEEEDGVQPSLNRISSQRQNEQAT